MPTKRPVPKLLWRLRNMALPMDFWANWTVVIAFVVLVVVFAIGAPEFLTVGNVEQVLTESAVLVILAVGESFVILTAGIDLSQAAVLTVAAVLLGQVAQSPNSWIGWGCLVALGTGAVSGLINGFVIAKGKITDFIVTLGSLGVASGIALVMTSGAPIQITNTFFLNFATGSFGPFGYPVFVAAAVVLAGHWALYHTRFGLHVLATGGSRNAASAMGVRVARVRMLVYVTSGFLAGLAAILYTAHIGAAEPAPDTTLLLDSIAATVLGGVSLFGGQGTIAGPALGALLLTALQNGLTLMSVSAYYEPLVVGLVVVAAAAAMRYQRAA